MELVQQILFTALLLAAGWLFARNIGRIRRNIFLGKDFTPSGTPGQRFANMARVALGQGKMVRRPLAGILHILVYAGFVLINIEILEIIIDGVAGTHRIFMESLGSLYGMAIGFFELLAVGVTLACVIFLLRRNGGGVKRFSGTEMKKWPVTDANMILITEIVLMVAVLIMNAADRHFQESVSTPVSSLLAPMFSGMSDGALHTTERVAWWFHILGVFAFMNYLPFSKHWHIIMAFPNTYYASLEPKGKFENLDYITTEVKLMLDPAATAPEGYQPPSGFGAKDVTDLSRKNLMDAYTCTECGRCTSVCPQNITGKLLSPRKIMMDTRDRLEEVGRNIDQHGPDFKDDKNLHSYISAEELWACNTCNACAEECPVNINPVDIIVQLRQHLVLEQSAAPAELNGMFTNLENNGAPWQFSAMDRANWTNA